MAEPGAAGGVDDEVHRPDFRAKYTDRRKMVHPFEPRKRRLLTTLIYQRPPSVWNDTSMTQCGTSESTFRTREFRLAPGPARAYAVGSSIEGRVH